MAEPRYDPFVVEFLWFPSGTSESERSLGSIAEVFEIIDFLRDSESEPAHEDEPDAWATCVVRRSDGQRMHVGHSREDWLLMLLDPTRIARASTPSDRVTVYLIPEWTDYSGRFLLDEEIGRRALQVWLSGGDPQTVVRFGSGSHFSAG